MEHVTDVAECFEHCVEGSGSNAPQVRFELGERHFDRIEVWAVSGQEQEPAALFSQGLGGAGTFVSGQIVKDHDSSGIERRGQLGFDVSVEGWAVHGSLDHPRRDQGVLRQPGDECLRAPPAEGCRAVEPLPDRSPPAQSGEVGLHGGLIDEDQSVRFPAHAWLAALDPITAGLAQRRSVTFCRDQPFFYMTVRRVRARDAATRAAPPRHVSRRGRRPTP